MSPLARRLAAVTVLAAALAAAPALADPAPAAPPAEAPPAEAPARDHPVHPAPPPAAKGDAAKAPPPEGDAIPHFHVWGEAGVRVLGGDLLVALRPGLLVTAPRLRLVLSPVFEVRPAPLAPGGSLLRTEDWDEITDYGRILNTFEASDEGGVWAVRAGRLGDVRLGHGTIVDDYVTSLDPDHGHTGAWATVAGDTVRVSMLAGEILSPQVLAMHLAVSPLRLVSPTGFAGWHLGLTGAADARAPVAFLGGATKVRLPQERHAALAIAGLDTDVVVWRAPSGSFAPYVDANLEVLGPRTGRGAVHLGVLLDLRFAGNAALAFKLEARRIGKGYLPEYFGATYSIARYAWPLGGTTPQAVAPGLPPTWGGRLEAQLKVGSMVRVALRADGREVGPGDVSLDAEVTGIHGFDAAVHLAHVGFHGWRAIANDSGWLGVAEARWHFVKAAYAYLRAGRIYRVDAVTGAYAPTTDLGLGAGGSF